MQGHRQGTAGYDADPPDGAHGAVAALRVNGSASGTGRPGMESLGMRARGDFIRHLDAADVVPLFYHTVEPLILLRADGTILETNLAARHLFALHVVSVTPERTLVFGDRDLCREASARLAQMAAGEVSRSRLLRRLDGQSWVVFDLECVDSDPPAKVLVRVRAPSSPEPDALREVGRALGLSAAELRVATQMCEGLSAKCIARALDLSPATVRTHMRAVYAKTGETGYHRTLRRLLLLLG